MWLIENGKGKIIETKSTLWKILFSINIIVT